jgi:hypothetical protein
MQLRISSNAVKPGRPLRMSYGELTEYLGSTHDVREFPYDWRKPVEEEADRFAELVSDALDEAGHSGMPVRILAHSMGGLVARTAMMRRPTVWNAFRTRPGARLIMLGTPNGGSHAITELLTARSPTLSKLALLDIGHQEIQFLQLIARFPGVLAMLPSEGTDDYFAADTWHRYHAGVSSGWVLPDAADLDFARDFRRRFKDAPIDPGVMIYVAGCAKATLCNLTLVEADAGRMRFRFEATNRGDGRVTWATGMLPGVPTWYMDTTHGDLAADPDAFPAIAELLETGRTLRLPLTPPGARDVEERFEFERDAETLFPDEESLLRDIMGSRATRQRVERGVETVTRVRVVHGDLAYARYPLAVGHYQDDAIVSAESALDVELDGELRRRFQLGLYPGPLGSSAVFFKSNAQRGGPKRLPGALIVGIGGAGSLSATALTRAFARALLEYVLEWSERRPANSEMATTTDNPTLGVSSLLIGTGEGGISVSEAVAALLRGVADANASLVSTSVRERIGEIEFIELWEDRALQAMGALAVLQPDAEFARAFKFAIELASSKGGRARPSVSEPPGWWHRLQILGNPEPHSTQRFLRFMALTRRARMEVRLHEAQRALVDELVNTAVKTTDHSPELSRTLFELLLPTDLKSGAPNEDNLVLLLDEESARYPWELLEDHSTVAAKREPEPFVIKHGLLRQLAVTDERPVPQPNASRSVLIVWDPVGPYPALPGARSEAIAVRDEFRRAAFDAVCASERLTGREVIEQLYSRPYRVLHLAAHGVYRFPAMTQTSNQDEQSLVTGVVMGKDMFLTALEVRQMRQVPELVFLNCCHLGRIEERINAADQQHREAFHLIASSLALEFIKMGVRAVVAAGWAVDDVVATLFARTFYEKMLAGVTFGEAVKQARRAAFRDQEQCNTWGAYQCYGDPDYRLVSEGEGRATRALAPFPSVSAALYEIGNRRAALQAIGGGDPARDLAALVDIRQRLEQQEWSERPRIALALALAHWDALDFEPALALYTKAITQNLQSASVGEIEQYANLVSRAAVQAWKDSKADLKRCVEQIEKARCWLEWLNDERSGGPTGERLSLLAGVDKRLAFMSNSPRTALPHVHAMIERYVESAERSRNSARLVALYPVLNGLFGDLVAHWLSSGSRRRTAVGHSGWNRNRLDEIRARVSASTDFEFWAEAARIDSDLLDALYAGDDVSWTALPDAYQALRRLSSRREFGSVLDHVKFLLRMATLAGRIAEQARLQGLVDTLAPARSAPSVAPSDSERRAPRSRRKARKPK